MLSTCLILKGQLFQCEWAVFTSAEYHIHADLEDGN